MATNLRTLFDAYDKGIAECTHPWELQLDLANRTFRYHRGLGYFVAPEPEHGDFVLILAPTMGSEAPVIDRPFIIANWHNGVDVKLYAWNRTARQRAKVFFDSSVEYNG